MRLILLFLFAFNLTGYSQLVMEETAVYTGDALENSIGSTFSVTNMGTKAQEFYWDIVKPEGFPEDWKFTVCDAVLCFPEGQESSECDDDSFINFLEPGQTITYYKVSIKPNGVPGDYDIQFRLTSTCGEIAEEDILAVQTISYSVSPPSSTKDFTGDNSIMIYPNPTADRFQINEDAGISNIAIYNIVGKEILAADHYENKHHDISGLDKGIYLVRMMDTTQDVVKVVRLTKE